MGGGGGGGGGLPIVLSGMCLCPGPCIPGWQRTVVRSSSSLVREYG